MEVDKLGFTVAEVERDGVATGVCGFDFLVEAPSCGIKSIAEIQFLTFSKFLRAIATRHSGKGNNTADNDCSLDNLLFVVGNKLTCVIDSLLNEFASVACSDCNGLACIVQTISNELANFTKNHMTIIGLSLFGVGKRRASRFLSAKSVVVPHRG